MEGLFLFLIVVFFAVRSVGKRFRRARYRARKITTQSTPRQEPPVSQATPRPFSAETAKPVAKGRVIRGAAYVIDGDSLVIKKTQVRLFGIDAPELNHPYGKKAKWAMVGLCKGQEVRAEIVEEDAYGRTVAKCHLPDGRDLSAELVKQGLAIDWPKFSGGQYRGLEVPDARKKMWLADARQNGRMHLWEQYEYEQGRKAGSSS